MRTKQEVINFLESKVGTTVPCKGTPSLDGQCVTLIKALMEFLGVPDPYKARGHAKTVISAYLNEGIAKPGTGFLSVFSNKNMGVSNGVAYGHIWCNAGDGDGVFYEQNGQKPLTVTKGKTYAYDNVCNFDSYINTQGEPTMPTDIQTYFGTQTDPEIKTKSKEHLGEVNGKCNWGAEGDNGGYLGSARKDLTTIKTKLGLPKQASMDQILEKITELQSQPAPNPDTKYVPTGKLEHRVINDKGDFDETSYKKVD